MDEQRLKREVEVWKELRHPHVLPFIGLCKIGQETSLVSPWMGGGDSISYLRANPAADCVRLVRSSTCLLSILLVDMLDL